MKRFWALFIILVFLCGCSAEKEVKISASPMSFDCLIEGQDEKYTVNVKTSENTDTIEASVTSPENLRDLKYTLQNDVFSTEYKGINTTADIKEAAEENTVILLLKVIKDTIGKPTVAKKDGNYEYSGNLDGFDYTVSVSPSGLPLGITVSPLGVTVEIKNLTLVN